MKLFLDYINKIKFYIILQMFPVILAEIIFFLYQLPIEPMVYVTVFWLLTGICACLNGFYRYRKKVQQLELMNFSPNVILVITPVHKKFATSNCASLLTKALEVRIIMTEQSNYS